MRVANGSLDEIEQEVASKVAFAKRGGGYIYHSDHSVPSEVSLANYQYLLAAVRRHGAGTVS
jgi:uroporphyrinogen-III decarboxylase